MNILFLIVGLIAGFVFGIGAIYVVFRAGNLLVIEQPEDDEINLFLELEIDKEQLNKKKFVIFDTKHRRTR